MSSKSQKLNGLVQDAVRHQPFPADRTVLFLSLKKDGNKKRKGGGARA